MKFTLALATFAAVVYGQTINDIPACALPSIEKAMTGVGCAINPPDVPCACAHFAAIQSAAINGVIAACGASVAINQVLPAVQKLCPS